jgi:hypothetical protein
VVSSTNAKKGVVYSYGTLTTTNANFSGSDSIGYVVAIAIHILYTKIIQNLCTNV